MLLRLVWLCFRLDGDDVSWREGVHTYIDTMDLKVLTMSPSTHRGLISTCWQASLSDLCFPVAFLIGPSSETVHIAQIQRHFIVAKLLVTATVSTCHSSHHSVQSLKYHVSSCQRICCKFALHRRPHYSARFRARWTRSRSRENAFSPQRQ